VDTIASIASKDKAMNISGIVEMSEAVGQINPETIHSLLLGFDNRRSLYPAFQSGEPCPDISLISDFFDVNLVD
jgi:hypothetical protein